MRVAAGRVMSMVGGGVIKKCVVESQSSKMR